MKIIVTGAASGIGRATAARLQQDASRRDGQAAELLLVDINALLTNAAAEVAALSARVETLVGDLADARIPARAVETAAQSLAD
jgi:NAD(P)-dependent dehydrogenase (short-subunit alcohol dehydrogenase family)